MVRKIRFNIPMLFIWIGGFFFCGIAFGESYLGEELTDKYKKRNIVTGILFLLTGVSIIFYSLIR